MSKKNKNKIFRIVVGVFMALVVAMFIYVVANRGSYEVEASTISTTQGQQVQQAPQTVPQTQTTTLGEGADNSAPFAYSQPAMSLTTTEYEGFTQEGLVIITTPIDEMRLMGVEPIDEVHLEFYDRFVVQRTFRLPTDEQGVIPREDFELNGRNYTFYSIRRVDTDQTHSVLHTEEITIETRTSDIIEIMNALYASLLFNDGTFVGELFLEYDTIRTTAMPAVSERRTMRDSRTYNNIAFGDISGIARTMTRSGVTLNLVDVEWVPVSRAVDYTPVSRAYNAVARYEGQYTRSVIPGFITTALYTGYITYFHLNPEIIFEITFASMRDGNDELAGNGGNANGNGNGSTVGSGLTHAYDAYGNVMPIMGFDENGAPIIGFNEQGNPILGYLPTDAGAGNGNGANGRIGGGVLGIVIIVVLALAGGGFLAYKLGIFKPSEVRDKFAGGGKADVVYAGLTEDDELVLDMDDDAGHAGRNAGKDDDEVYFD